MIVVVIMGVLASVAVVAYGVYVRRARTAEAAGLLSNMKASQESYRSEFGMYCDVADPEPDAIPTRYGAVWGAGGTWQQLGFRPDTPVVTFQLNTVAGAPTEAVPATVLGAGPGMTGTPTEGNFTDDHWFIAFALGDQDQDGDQSLFWITSATSAVAYRDRTEPLRAS
jgi:type II secretory pathway pseudopilin PulG